MPCAGVSLPDGLRSAAPPAHARVPPGMVCTTGPGSHDIVPGCCNCRVHSDSDPHGGASDVSVGQRDDDADLRHSRHHWIQLAGGNKNDSGHCDAAVNSAANSAAHAEITGDHHTDWAGGAPEKSAARDSPGEPLPGDAQAQGAASRQIQPGAHLRSEGLPALRRGRESESKTSNGAPTRRSSRRKRRCSRARPASSAGATASGIQDGASLDPTTGPQRPGHPTGTPGADCRPDGNRGRTVRRHWWATEVDRHDPLGHAACCRRTSPPRHGRGWRSSGHLLPCLGSRKL